MQTYCGEYASAIDEGKDIIMKINGVQYVIMREHFADEGLTRSVDFAEDATFLRDKIREFEAAIGIAFKANTMLMTERAKAYDLVVKYRVRVDSVRGRLRVHIYIYIYTIAS